jgi:5'-deoxynucleotidase YfbR-like HD superfamily hydrolase
MTQRKRSAAHAVINLGALALKFARVNRVTYHEDGRTPESDTDHTVMLGLIACAYAARYATHLDVGKIAAFSLIHDLVEVYAGDTPTVTKVAWDKKKKHEREMRALKRIQKEFSQTLPWIHKTIAQYESLKDPEARFVKTMDKVMPKITHFLNGGKTLKKYGYTPQEHKADLDTQRNMTMAHYTYDQKEALKIYDEVRVVLYNMLTRELRSPQSKKVQGKKSGHQKLKKRR